MKRKVALHNLGCKVNAYETEAIGQLLEAALRDCAFRSGSGYLCDQYLYGDEYSRQKIPPDAA